jgi:hypothetical protein
MLAALAQRKAKKNTPGKVKPSSSSDGRAQWLEMASRQDDALNKEGTISGPGLRPGAKSGIHSRKTSVSGMQEKQL